jgi:hypothetical protein
MPQLAAFPVDQVALPSVLILRLRSHLSGAVSQTGPTPVVYDPAQASGTITLDSPQAVTANPLGVISTGLFDGQNTTPVMTLTSFSTASLDEAPLDPMIVIDTAGSASASWAGSVTDQSSAQTRAVNPVFPMGGAASVSSGSVPGGALGGGVVSGIPDLRHVQIESMLNGPQGSETFVIPINAGTQSLDLSLHGLPGEAPGDAPILDGMMLLNREGEPISQFAPTLGMQQTQPQMRSVSVSIESAAEGGNLVVQISVPSSISSEGTLSTSDSPLSFLLDIQRQDPGNAPAIGAGIYLAGGPISGAVRSGITALTTSTMSGQGSNSSSSTDPASNLGTESDANALPLVGDQGDDILADSESGEDLSGGFNVRVSSGPLASRSASPLGPALATILSDLAPPVDRHERALSQSIDESESGDESEAERLRLEYARIESDASSSETDVTNRSKAGETCVALAGLGAFPLKVTGLRGQGDREDLESLLAALPDSLSPEDPSEIIASEEFDESDISAWLASSGHTARADQVAPDYLTAACGLALGLGLTAGPLFPDILALITSGTSRWRTGGPLKSSSRKPASIPGPNRGMGNRPRGFLDARLLSEKS